MASRRLTWGGRGALFCFLLAAACSATNTTGSNGSNGSNGGNGCSGAGTCISGAKLVGSAPAMFCETDDTDPNTCPIETADEYATTNTENTLHCSWFASRQMLGCRCDFDPCGGTPVRVARTTAPDEATMLDLWKTHCGGQCLVCDGVCSFNDSAINLCETGPCNVGARSTGVDYATTNTTNSLHCKWSAGDTSMKCRCDLDSPCDLGDDLPQTTEPDKATLVGLWQHKCGGNQQCCFGVCPKIDGGNVATCDGGSDAPAD
jgi:hypothetical protein